MRKLLFLIISLLALLPFSPTSASNGNQVDTETYILSTQPVFYLPLWKKDGARIASDDVYGLACNETSATWTLQGREFNGTTNAMDFGTFNDLLLGNTNKAIIAWVKPNTPGGVSNHFAVSLGAPSASTAFLLGCSTTVANTVLACGTAGTNLGTGSAIPDASWTMLTGVYDAPNLKLYINDQLDATKNITSTSTASGRLIVGGGYYDSPKYYEPWKGTIGDVIVYSRAPSDMEIGNIYQKTKGRYK